MHQPICRRVYCSWNEHLSWCNHPPDANSNTGSSESSLAQEIECLGNVFSRLVCDHLQYSPPPNPHETKGINGSVLWVDYVLGYICRLTNNLDDQAPIAIWTDLEVGVGIICGCLPSFRSLIGYMFPSLKMSLVPSYEGNTLVHWTGSRSKNKHNSAGLNTGVASFMELEDLHGSRHNLNQTKNEQRSVITRGSGASITE